MKKLREFEKRFFEEIVEMLVLTMEKVGGAAVYGDMLKPSVGFCASVDLKTGNFSEEKGRLEWMIKSTPDREGWGFDFDEYVVYSIKARKGDNNSYMVVDIVDDHVVDERLEKIRERISKPVVISDKILGEYTLDRHLSWFEGEIQRPEIECTVYLETDEEDGETAEKSLKVLRDLYNDFENYDEKFRSYAAKELTELANDWLEDEEDSEDIEEITEKDFAERIEISELTVSPDGDLTIYYNDDDMFWGHAIEVRANIDGTIDCADMVG